MQFVRRDFHEVQFRRIATHLINEKLVNKNIIDSGAWIGDNAIPWAMNIKGTVYAIDPSAVNCAYIEEVCALNGITNVEVIEKALSDKKEVLTTEHDLEHAIFTSSQNNQNKVSAVTIDFLYKKGIVRDVDFIHLDVEGYEERAIIGAKELITECQPIIAYEQHMETDNCASLINIFKEMNYTVYLINEVLPGCRTDCRNFIAFPARLDIPMVVNNIIFNLGIKDILL